MGSVARISRCTVISSRFHSMGFGPVYIMIMVILWKKTGSQAVDDTMKQEYAVWMDIIDCVISSVN